MTNPLDDALTLTKPVFLPIDDIDPEAFLRDRSHMDEDALAELMGSIVSHGLRQPVEVTGTGATPPYALISGSRRLEAMRRTGYTKIPALIRDVTDPAQILARIVGENEVRESIPPWDRGRIIFQAVEQGWFDTIEEAVQRLHAHADRQKKQRMRMLATAYGDFSGWLTDPGTYSERQLRRLASASDAGHFDLMQAACRDLEPGYSAHEQWEVLERICWEIEQPRRELKDAPNPRRRVVVRAPARLVIRRERTREGWNLRFSGTQATGAVMEDVMSYVERWFGEG
jgi:ParB family chromosome partitioning protein